MNVKVNVLQWLSLGQEFSPSFRSFQAHRRSFKGSIAPRPAWLDSNFQLDLGLQPCLRPVSEPEQEHELEQASLCVCPVVSTVHSSLQSPVTTVLYVSTAVLCVHNGLVSPVHSPVHSSLVSPLSTAVPGVPCPVPCPQQSHCSLMCPLQSHVSIEVSCVHRGLVCPQKSNLSKEVSCVHRSLMCPQQSRVSTAVSCVHSSLVCPQQSRVSTAVSCVQSRVHMSSAQSKCAKLRQTKAEV
ncbi:hypothetical protein WMY93_019413 [Mugilogobius chulae]|uniref:Uncharacterized protein n=1 Tax=Mugilogobius chulae TaxID=88201 RepID=A0AAW0NE58_9GOBI